MIISPYIPTLVVEAVGSMQTPAFVFGSNVVDVLPGCVLNPDLTEGEGGEFCARDFPLGYTIPLNRRQEEAFRHYFASLTCREQ